MRRRGRLLWHINKRNRPTYTGQGGSQRGDMRRSQTMRWPNDGHTWHLDRQADSANPGLNYSDQAIVRNQEPTPVQVRC